MQRTSAAVGTSIFFALAPGTVAGLIPWGLTGWHPHHTQASAWIPFRVLGAALIAAALPVLVAAFVRFAKEGIGTPAPIAPTEHLVAGGPYNLLREVRLGQGHTTCGSRTISRQPIELTFA